MNWYCFLIGDLNLEMISTNGKKNQLSEKALTVERIPCYICPQPMCKNIIGIESNRAKSSTWLEWERDHFSKWCMIFSFMASVSHDFGLCCCRYELVESESGIQFGPFPIPLHGLPARFWREKDDEEDQWTKQSLITSP